MSTEPPASNQAIPGKHDAMVRYLDTLSAYEAWSDTYDTDGNFLQALDTIEMKELLPKMVSLIEEQGNRRVVDLGCGTGRSTTALLKFPGIEVTAVDLSPKMLDLARKRLDDEFRGLSIKPKVNFLVFDMLTGPSIPREALNADALISTLVVEHVPLDVYFSTVEQMLRPGGLCLLTNMHSEMGKISQAGFVDPKTGEKIRPTSFAHTIDETVEEAERHGLKVVGHLEQRSVDAGLAPKLGPRAEKWIGVTVWFGGIFQKAR